METNDSIKYLNNIKMSFNKMKTVTVAAVVACVVISLGSVAFAYRFATGQREQIYVLDDGSVLQAMRSNNMAQRDEECKEHVTRFHELFFNVSPNTETVNKNAAAALALADKSAYNYFNDLKEKQFYMRLIQNNATQQVIVDSINVNIGVKPYKAVTYLTRYYNRPSGITKYRMVTTCDLAESQRGPTNPHGLIIQRFTVVEDTELETRVRR